MTLLCEWLEARKLTNSPQLLNDPNNVGKTLDEDGQWIASEQISLKTIRAMQRVLQHLHLATAGLIGSHGEVYSFASKSTWIATDIAGDVITLSYVMDVDDVPTVIDPKAAPGPCGVGCLQVGDVLRFQSPSALWAKVEPSIIEIVSANETAVQVRLNIDCSEGLFASASEEVGGLTAVAVDLWRYNSLELWQNTDPVPEMGVRRNLSVSITTLDGDKAYTLGSFPIVAPDSSESLRVEGWNGSAWTDITGSQFAGTSATSRIIITTDADGNYETKIYFGSSGYQGRSHTSDLTATYSAFSVRYDKLIPDGTGFCFATCKEVQWDYSASLQNWGASSGIGAPMPGGTPYCAKRQVATGLQDGGTFPTNGKCLKWGSCSHNASIDTAPYIDQPLTVQRGLGRAIRQMNCSVSARLDTAVGGALTMTRVEVPSVYLLAGTTYGLTSPTGFHTISTVVGEGVFGTAITALNLETGDERLEFRTGAYWGPKSDWSDFVWGDKTTYPPPGLLASVLGNHVDPLDWPYGIADERDPHGDLVLHPDRAGWGLAHDSGAYVGKGLHQYAHVGAPEEITGSKLTFTRHETPETILGKSIGGSIAVAPLAYEDQGEQSGVSRNVFSVTSLGNYLYKIELQNATHTVVSGFSEGADLYSSWKAGGGPGCLPPDFARIKSAAESGQYGSTAAQGGPGSFIGIDDQRFLIDRIEPFSGEEAASYEGDTPDDGQIPCGQYTSFAKKHDVVYAYDDAGFLDSLASGDAITFYFTVPAFAPSPDNKLYALIGGTYAEVPASELIFEHGRSLIHVTESYLAANAVAGWKFAGRRMDIRCRPSADMINTTIDCINALNTTCRDVPGGVATSGVAMQYGTSALYRYVDLVGDYDLPDHTWHVKRFAVPTFGVMSATTLKNIHEGAVQTRALAASFTCSGKQLIQGTAYADVHQLSVADISDGEIPNVTGIISGPTGWFFDTDISAYRKVTCGEGITGIGGYYYSEDPWIDGLPMVVDSVSSNQVTDANWVSAGHNGPYITGPGGVLGDDFFGQTPSDPSGPGWNHAPVGDPAVNGDGTTSPISGSADTDGTWMAFFESWPHKAIAPWFTEWIAAGNYVGGTTSAGAGGVSCDFGAKIIGQPTAIGLPDEFRYLDGLILVDAELDVKFTGLFHYHEIATTEIVDGVAVTTTDATDETLTCGIILLGARIDPESANLMWEPLGADLAQEGELENGKWHVLDARGVAQVLYDNRANGYFAFGFLPATIGDITGIVDAKTLLKSFLPKATYEYYTNPDATDPGYPANLLPWDGEFAYQSYFEYQYITWTTIEIGKLKMTFQLPDSGLERAVQIHHVPFMN